MNVWLITSNAIALPTLVLLATLSTGLSACSDGGASRMLGSIDTADKGSDASRDTPESVDERDVSSRNTSSPPMADVVRETGPPSSDASACPFPHEPSTKRAPWSNMSESTEEALVNCGTTGSDPDDDRLSTCEEEVIGTDPREADTDGDGLSDFEELQKQINPLDADTDDDGATDQTELNHGLHPLDPVTYDHDCTRDGERWVLNACDSDRSASIQTYESSTGDWTLALPSSVETYRDSDASSDVRGNELTIIDKPDSLAAAVYGEADARVAGALLSDSLASDSPAPNQTLRERISSRLAADRRTVEQQQIGGHFDTHDGHRAARAEYRLTLEEPRSPRELRNRLLVELADGAFERRDVQGLPEPINSRARTFELSVLVIDRPSNSDGTGRRLLAIGVAPTSAHRNRQETRVRLDEFVGANHIAAADASTSSACRARYRWQSTTPPYIGSNKVDVYWVLDVSNAMRPHRQRLEQWVSGVHNRLKQSGLDVRTGLTNMTESNQGRLPASSHWHRDGDTLSRALQRRIIDCESTSDWACSTDETYGISVARQGLEHMLGRGEQAPSDGAAFRPNAHIVTIFATGGTARGAAEATPPQDTSVDTEHPAYERFLDRHRPFFQRHTTVQAIVGDGEDCGRARGQTYRELARATGGRVTSLCDGEPAALGRQLAFWASGGSEALEYTLSEPAISSSIRVEVDGQQVPRSREQGFTYRPSRNVVDIVGDRYRPETSHETCMEVYGIRKCRCAPRSDEVCKLGEFATDAVAIHYETYASTDSE